MKRKFLRNEFNLIQVIKIVIMITAGLYGLWFSLKVLGRLETITYLING